jgi:hypothetical protein
MARIILGSYMVRYPLGGNLSWALQWLVGFQQLGHDIYFVEKGAYPNACFDPTQGIMTDDCYYGTVTLKALLERFNLQDKWCFVDFFGNYYGLSREQITEVFQSADLFIDMGTHGSWLDEAADCACRVLVELEPGYTQIKMEQKIASGEILPNYDAYYTNGSNIGTDKSEAPTAGKDWHHVINPVVASLFSVTPAPVDAPLTTVMNWQAHELIQFQGKTYGQKDREFAKFIDLPKYAVIPLELAVSGKNLPSDDLVKHGWRLRSAHQVTESVDSFWNYIRSSRGEFSVCKNVFVATNSGWFSDRSAAYLASGRPVVMQDTGFSNHLPCGEGLFAVGTVEETAAAMDAIASNYTQHSQAARHIALEYLEAKKVLGKFLDELGIS